MKYKVLYLAVLILSFCNLLDALDLFKGGIIKGKSAKINEFSYVVLIRKVNREFSNGRFLGSGSLISPQRVLTSATCIYSKGVQLNKLPPILLVIAGNIYKDREQKDESEHKVARVYVHRDYKDAYLHNNIALIILVSPVIEAPNRGFIKPSTADFEAGMSCTLLGWSYRSVFSYRTLYSSTLQYSETTIISKEHCKALYNQTVGYEILDTQICAGPETKEKDSCVVGTGAPIVCNNTIYGIFSLSFPCGNPQFPGIYTDVTKYSKFLSAPEAYALSRGTRRRTKLLNIFISAIFYWNKN